MKVCSKCKQEKSFDAFGKVGGKKGNLLRSICKSCAAIRYKEYCFNNKQQLALARKEYKKKNRRKIREYDRQYRKVRREQDPNFKLSKILRTRLCMALRQNNKGGSAVEDLGCSVEDLRTYLESKFQSGMTWNNYGKGFGKWQIDHIKPLYSFELANRTEFLKACHYTNLQPLWHAHHVTKTKKDIQRFYASRS